MLWLTPATSQWKAIPHLQVSLQFPAFPYFSVERNPEISATDPDPQSPSCQPSLVIQLKATCIINVLRQLVVSLLNFICICYCLIQNLTNRKKDWSCMTAKIAQWLGTKRGGGGGGVVLLGPVHLPYWSKYLSRQCVLWYSNWRQVTQA